MDFSDALQHQITNLLYAYTGRPVSVVESRPITEGWSAQFGTYPWVRRYFLQTDTNQVPESVIVKIRRADFHSRSKQEYFQHEQAALEFLTSIGSTFGPRLLASNAEVGIMIIEDLGTGPALEELLVGNDALVAEHGLVAFATGLGQMHASTANYAEEYYQLRSRFGPVDPAFDRISLFDNSIEYRWKQLKEIVSQRFYLPKPVAVDRDIDEFLGLLAEPGPYLAFTNGDTGPNNCRILDQGVRFIDFEHAAFRHALLDVAALRFPFPASGCWSHLPENVSQRVEEAYRKTMASSCPAILDDTSYAQGLAAACAAWTIVRAVRLPKLENVDQPQPLGFSRRGQLLDTISTTVKCLQQAHTLPSLLSWLTALHEALSTIWSHLPPRQPFYPPFQSSRDPHNEDTKHSEKSYQV